MNKVIRSVVILGGGTAGWLTAGILAAKLKQEKKSGYKITLIESPDIKTVGVGEGTWPTMRKTLASMGINESDFIQECQVSFKQGAKFSRWVTGLDDDHYYHPLMLPQGNEQFAIAKHWLAGDRNLSFAHAVCPQAKACDLNLAPKRIVDAEYRGPLNYAYHLDAGAFVSFLKKHCCQNLQVNYVSATVTSVQSDVEGDITGLMTDTQGLVSGDLFIDCSGFNSRLLAQHYQIPFVSQADVLFADTALAVHVPYADANTGIASMTLSTAQSAGWIWDIGLPSRRGVGHVFSSNYISQQVAEDELAQYIKNSGGQLKDAQFKKIAINCGHRQTFWHKNSVAIGLAAGFFEPLEASALLLIEISAQSIAQNFPTNRAAMSLVAKQYNRMSHYRWARILDFLKLHYLLNQRQDSQFWIDNRAAESIPESLQEKLALWQYQVPSDDDFEQAVEVFPAASYLYILYGMGFNTQPDPLGISSGGQRLAEHYFSKNQQQFEHLAKSLTQHKTLLDKIQQYGLQKI
ncbi:tryptophan halogenase family protein [Gayadomonas joobiniege]|uniref:tryptophan halogenase family protein n=1 Tax=Gayadomonas joobiniege TaxID=1234606 RepID=UPI00036E8A59|nr:tryptophan halogenase family protein [Gayadomonas joobiniege]